jgi:predicted ATP-binding protein involved in virulence
MYLRRFKIHGIKCFDELELTFVGEDGQPRLWNVLLGENGTGKSTLLQAMAVALMGETAAGRLVRAPGDWVRHNDKQGGFEAEIVRSEFDQKVTDHPRQGNVQAPAQIFLSYARPDQAKVENIYQKLSDIGFKPWMDTKDLLPGESWEAAIRRAIQRSDFILVCLSSNSANRRGFLQREIKEDLGIWRERLDSDIYLIPVRLEECNLPEGLEEFQGVDLFEKEGWTRLVQAIQIGMDRRGEIITSEEESEQVRPLLAYYAITGTTETEVDGKPYASPAIVLKEPSDLRHAGDPNVLRRTVYAESLTGWFAAGYGPFRRLSGGSPEGEAEARERGKGARFVSLFWEEAALTGCSRWLQDLDYAAQEDATKRRILEAVREVFRHLLPAEVSLAEISAKGVFFAKPQGPLVPIQALSDGYRSLLALAGDLLHRLTDAFPDPELLFDAEGRVKAEGIVLIDEVDAHMHPTWQQQFSNWLQERFPRLQFIVATHSPFIPQAASEGGIIVLRESPEGGKVIADTRVESVKGYTANQIFNTLFGLSTTRDPATARALQRLESLAGRAQRTPEEEAEYQALQQQLGAVLPPPGDTLEAREAQAALQRLVAQAQALLNQSATEQSPERQEA